MFNQVYRHRRVLITGHTGFKGSWLAAWLRRLGAVVGGYALPPPTEPSHWDCLGLQIDSAIGDLRDLERLVERFAEFAPDIVFHLAAQPLVRESYRAPLETLAVNVLGSAHVFEAARRTASVRAVVNVTSDKCYENREWAWGYRESDPMGGHDPYSASKGCAELVAASYRRSFFAAAAEGGAPRVLLASCRAGNVIGGGDWAVDRLVPDLMKTAARGEIACLRNPGATRPWQHVLEPLSGYLLVGQRLLEGDAGVADSWNFGPEAEATQTVGQIAEQLAASWPAIRFESRPEAGAPHEAGLLSLDCSKARRQLGWWPAWSSATALARTAAWYRDYYESDRLNTLADLDAYVAAARRRHCRWAE